MSDHDDQLDLMAFLADRDEPCPRCGYNLRGLTGRACPECGAVLKLRVGLVEPRIAAYVIAIGLAFMGFGGSLLFLLLVVFYAGLRWVFDDGMISTFFLVLQLLSTGLFLVLALTLRRWLLRWPGVVQWLIALAMGGWVLLMFAMVLLTFNS